MKVSKRTELMVDISQKVHDLMITDEVAEHLVPEELAAAILIPVKEMLDFIFKENSDRVVKHIIKKINLLNEVQPHEQPEKVVHH